MFTFNEDMTMIINDINLWQQIRMWLNGLSMNCFGKWINTNYVFNNNEINTVAV